MPHSCPVEVLGDLSECGGDGRVRWDTEGWTVVLGAGILAAGIF